VKTLHTRVWSQRERDGGGRLGEGEKNGVGQTRPTVRIMLTCQVFWATYTGFIGHLSYTYSCL
jgi:hypothetical protein